MKKIITIFALATGIYACDSGTDNKPGATTTTTAAATETAKADVTSTPEFMKGLDLVKGSDCATCHKIDEKIIGPAFRDIANKYTNNEATVDMLANKIIKGGSGNWGAIAMTPHSGLSVDDAKAMAQYVLLLKNN